MCVCVCVCVYVCMYVYEGRGRTEAVGIAVFWNFEWIVRVRWLVVRFYKGGRGTRGWMSLIEKMDGWRDGGIEGWTWNGWMWDALLIFNVDLETL